MTPMIDITTAPMCDFCGAQPPPASMTWLPCRTFDRLTIARRGTLTIAICTCCERPPATEPGDVIEVYTSLSAWVACRSCRALVDVGDRDGLVKRAAEQLAGSGCIPVPRTLLAVAAAHEGYWRHRESSN